MGLNHTEKFLHGKEIFNKMEVEPTVWKNIFGNDTLDKVLSYKIYKELT